VELMADEQAHSAEHTIEVSAPPDIVYGLIADVTSWSHLFPPTIHAERVAGDDSEERVRLWAFANDEVKTWISRRWLDSADRSVRFRQEVPHPPVRSMTGQWSMRPGPAGGTTVVLTHAFSVNGDGQANAAYIADTVDRNSRSELAALKAAAERYAQLPDLVLSFEEALLIGGDGPAVYDFIYRCAQWPQRLPHVARLTLREDEPGLQLMEMDTRTPDGGIHTTKSVRICFPATRIIYRQVVVPPFMAAHTGQWLFTESSQGIRAVSRHTVVIKPDAVPGTPIADMRQRIREALGANSLTTLRQAKAHVEGRA
jgi:aromatase